MKCLVLADNFPPHIGGSGRWLWELYRRLPRHEFVIAAGEHPHQEAFDRSHDLQVVRLPLHLSSWGFAGLRPLKDYWRLARRLSRLVDKEHVTSVHAASCLPEGFLAWLLSRWKRLAYSVFVHGEELNVVSTSRELSWMARRVFRGAEMLIANSHNTARLLSDGWAASTEQIRVLHPGVATDQFVPAPFDPDVRKCLGWTDRRVILTVGRLQKRKGHDFLIQALPEIRRHIPNVLYAIAGDGDEREALEKLVDQHQVREHVQFLGAADQATLVKCYQQCDLFALPNREVDGDFEGFGIVVLEAQACGKGVLVGASGGTPETLCQNVTGRAVNCDDPQVIAHEITALLSDAAKLAQFGEEARRWVVRQFAWNNVGERAAALLGPRLVEVTT